MASKASTTLNFRAAAAREIPKNSPISPSQVGTGAGGILGEVEVKERQSCLFFANTEFPSRKAGVLNMRQQCYELCMESRTKNPVGTCRNAPFAKRTSPSYWKYN